MYAVFQLSGFQFSAQEGDTVLVPLQKAAGGEKIDISEVLLIKDGDNTHIGQPFLSEASVEAEVVKHGRHDKIEVGKYKRRTKYRRKTGHRQDYSELKINKIVAPQS